MVVVNEPSAFRRVVEVRVRRSGSSPSRGGGAAAVALARAGAGWLAAAGWPVAINPASMTTTSRLTEDMRKRCRPMGDLQPTPRTLAAATIGVSLRKRRRRLKYRRRTNAVQIRAVRAAFHKLRGRAHKRRDPWPAEPVPRQRNALD